MSWLGPVRQISYTTDDLDTLLNFWEKQVGIGPWSVFRGLTLTMNYGGRKISLPVDVALTVHAGMLVELLQAKGDGPSPFHDQENQPIIGLQRVATLSENIVEDTEHAQRNGLELFADGADATGQRYCYFRSAAAPGIILELLEDTPFFREFVDQLTARSLTDRQT
ncbi:VOC family protein [Rhodococcus sp. NPDC127528]|uniref:VOC family protein n=1 Tax=unclassified Rhodococcus (in: high G+C Gram-positive bacteria) TaxID=192944 RepID=UPI0036374E8D